MPFEHMAAIPAFRAEVERLQLRLEDLPGGLALQDADAFQHLLRAMRALEAPATWRDVFPDLPAHWVAGRPETWTTRYRPFGPYDYQSLPTAPAVHVQWQRETDHAVLDNLVAAARSAGFSVHGAGFLEMTNPAWSTLDAMIILGRGTTATQLDAFTDWLLEQSDVALAAIPRRGDEEYV